MSPTPRSPRRDGGAGGDAPTAALRPTRLDAEPTPDELPHTLHADAELLAVSKPAGWLTHGDGNDARPDVVTWAGEGHTVHHRLDVDTTGVLLLGRGASGRARLHAAFAEGQADKRYLAVVEGGPDEGSGVLRGAVPRAPEREAETRWRVLRRGGGWALLEVWPRTGRTHQIRAHLAAAGWPIRGDGRYGSPLDRRAPRTLLHCAEVRLPGGAVFAAPPPPDLARYLGQPPSATRLGLRDDPRTTCYRELAGEADGCPGWTVDRYGDWLWVQRAAGAPEGPLPECRGAYQIDAQADRSRGGQPAPTHARGEAAPAPLVVAEHGVQYQVELGTRLSTGLFLDQRPQRAWLAGHAGGWRVLNTFAHAGGYSVAAGVAGAQTVSVDLSSGWLNRIAPQMALNGVDPSRHDTIYGDVFDWVRRLARRGEVFDLVILDPPSTSVGRVKRRWSAARDYPALVAMAAPLVAPGGRLWTTTNHRQLSPERFAGLVQRGLPEGARLERVAAPAVDFPTDGPAPVKTLMWSFPE